MLFGAAFNCDVPCTTGLLEIHPVNPGCVVIRGAATARFLCIEGDGKLYSSVRKLKSHSLDSQFVTLKLTKLGNILM